MTPAERNRRRAPEFAAFVDEMRAAFGDIKVRWVRYPDGTEQGKRGPEGAVAHPPPNLKRAK